MADNIKLRYVTLLACTGALGGLLFGFDIAIITGAGPFIRHAFSLGDLGLGWAFSSLLFGCVVGSLFAGYLADRYGRRRLLISVAIVFALTSVATAVAGSFATFIAARFFGGIAVGAVSLTSPMYIAEISPSPIRGRMGSLYQLSIMLGVIISFGTNYLLRDAGTDNWRWMFLSGVVPSSVFLILITNAPETPRFLVMKGLTHKASIVLERIGGNRSVSIQIANIVASMHRHKRSGRGGRRPGVRRALFASIVLAVLVQASGINTIMDYAPEIFQSSGSRLDSALASTFCVALTEFLFTLVSLCLIDKRGRKPLYITGSFGMALNLIALAALVLTGHFHGALVLLFVLGFLAFFSLGVGPVFWTLVPEIFPDDVRGRAMTVPVVVQWVANAIVVLLFPLAFRVIGKAPTFGFLCLMAICQGGYAWHAVPETRDRCLENIEDYWVRTRAPETF